MGLHLLLGFSIVFLFLTIIGLYKPWLVFWWSDFANRKKVLIYYGSTAVIAYAVYLVLS